MFDFGAANTSYNDDRSVRMAHDLDSSRDLRITTMHLSCRSDPLDYGTDMVGMALWSYQGKTDWRLNGVHCQTGYVYIKSSRNISHLTSSMGQVHGKLYKHLFGQEPDGVVATGFAIKDGEIRWSSYTFNTTAYGQGSGYMNADREASPGEKEMIKRTIHRRPGETFDLRA